MQVKVGSIFCPLFYLFYFRLMEDSVKNTFHAAIYFFMKIQDNKEINSIKEWRLYAFQTYTCT